MTVACAKPAENSRIAPSMIAPTMPNRPASARAVSAVCAMTLTSSFICLSPCPVTPDGRGFHHAGLVSWLRGSKRVVAFPRTSSVACDGRSPLTVAGAALAFGPGLGRRHQIPISSPSCLARAGNLATSTLRPVTILVKVDSDMWRDGSGVFARTDISTFCG